MSDRTIAARDFELAALVRGLRPGALVMRLAGRLRRWQERARERRQLAALDARELADIGVSLLDAQREARKPFWRD